MLPPRNAAIREALTGHGVVLVVGAHAFSPHHYTPGPAIPEKTRGVRLNDDPAELGRTFAVELGLTGDIRASLTELISQVGRRANPRVRSSGPQNPLLARPCVRRWTSPPRPGPSRDGLPGLVRAHRRRRSRLGASAPAWAARTGRWWRCSATGCAMFGLQDLWGAASRG